MTLIKTKEGESVDIVLHGTVADIVHNQMELGKYDSAEDVVYEALEALVKKNINDGLERGLQDIEEGNFIELTPSNISSVADAIVSKSI